MQAWSHVGYCHHSASREKVLGIVAKLLKFRHTSILHGVVDSIDTLLCQWFITVCMYVQAIRLR